MDQLVNRLKKNGYLRSPAIIDAFLNIKREDFVLPELKDDAYEDIALPIGHGQTISQPLTVAFMLEALDARSGHNVLDVGSGSGWTTALLSHIVGTNGHVTAIERQEDLKKFGEQNAEKYGQFTRGVADFHVGDGSKGYPARAPYDRILVSAAADCVPNHLKEQLKVGGKIIIPIESSVWLMEKIGENKFMKEEYPGFIFVPLVEG